MSNPLSRIADFAQRTVTVTLIAWTGFQIYQIGKNVNEGWVRKKETGFFEEIKKRREEDSKNDGRIDIRPDFYTEENEDEYKKTIPRFQVKETPVEK